ncbi:2Fe-2S iron-sulfur cluster-binding protein [Pseudogemmobacter faecipullorum]|uniref:2Fe-2S iron-sulfur cluster binding domain-containing protein n=1 Tax=Pseudogemmobacter faecipullorum TaxID=2755041 RepID=A0ABS8CR87_9RHOB|nr:2Fe-2S iron-sulfur cluster-binding protein [Pseudogemmobacter faecipullorum]MCB5411922.1 2Fe-2S iron-sulfur cluster binding domain-containing protein [Pseudogemmobacter faecipullorum]
MADAFRKFRVARKHPESSVITSFHLVPADGGALWPARPGQYLTLRIPGPEGPVLRTYSLSNAVDATDCHRISVKRETGLNGNPDGIGSGWLHDHLAAGDEIEVAAPRGAFFLDEGSTLPVLLLAGGVGVTPMMSMLHRLAQGSRKAWLVHAVESSAVQPLRAEVERLVAASSGRITACNVLRNPAPGDHPDVTGVVNASLLQSLLPLDDYQVYLCGPVPFMVAMWRLLTSLGIAPERIGYEFFGPGGALPKLAAGELAPPGSATPRIPVRAPKSLDRLDYLTNPDVRKAAEPAARNAAAAAGPDAMAESGNEVVFARSGVTLAWNSGVKSILELAESAGLDPAFVCRSGICNSCRCTVKAGQLDYFSEPLDPPGPGQALICCSRPNGRVVLDL